MKNRNAFTLVEMIAVIVIIGIIVAVGIPAMSGLTRAAGLQGGVRQLSNAMQLARQMAITHRTTATLQMTPTTFFVLTNSTLVDKVNNLPIGVVIDTVHSSATSLIFKPTGALNVNGDQFIIVQEGTTNNLSSLVATNGSNISTVSVSAILGRVTYQ